MERALDQESGGPDSSPVVACISLFDLVYITFSQLCYISYLYYTAFPLESCFHQARSANLESLNVGVKEYMIGIEIARKLKIAFYAKAK